MAEEDEPTRNEEEDDTPMEQATKSDREEEEEGEKEVGCFTYKKNFFVVSHCELHLC